MTRLTGTLLAVALSIGIMGAAFACAYALVHLVARL